MRGWKSRARNVRFKLLVPYSGISVIKNKKAEECIEIINLNIPPRHLSPSQHGD
jgi:hypothetical protein